MQIFTHSIPRLYTFLGNFADQYISQREGREKTMGSWTQRMEEGWHLSKTCRKVEGPKVVLYSRVDSQLPLITHTLPFYMHNV